MSRNKEINKHTIDTANESLLKKDLDFIKAVRIEENTILLLDRDYGEYRIDIKSLSPKTQVPLHKERVFHNKLELMKKKYIGKNISSFKIKDVIYGPDHGYKNRSFYFIYNAECGHEKTNTQAVLKRTNSLNCAECKPIKHGERKKVNGELPKRSNTYTHWQRIKKTLPIELQEYINFRKIVGDKPAKRADIVFINNKPEWKILTVIDNYEINLISSAIRQAFRWSALYNNVVNSSKVETEEGTRYRCAHCNNLFKRSEIEVDHIDPIAHLSGEDLKREDLIERIWTEKIQVLDHKCHTIKTKEQTALRKLNKEKLKK